MSDNKKFGFMRSIFNGHVPEEFIHHFPFFNTDREEDYMMMSSSIKDWLNQNVDSLKFDKEKKIPSEIIKDMKEMGLFGLIIPEAFGGSEFSQTLYTRTLELLNQFDASITLTVGAHSSIGLKGLYLYGNDEQKAKYMPKLASGEMIAAFALTEPGAGSDAAAIKTRIVRKGDHYILNGSKLWITNGGFADFFTVFAKENIAGEDKITALIVTRDLGGITHGHEESKLGICASSTVEVFFKDVKVPVENVLGKPGEGFKIGMSILNQGRVGLAGGALGAMKSALNECITYTKNRKAFGQPISEFGVIRNLLTEMVMNIYSAEAMTYFTTHMIDSGDTEYSIEAAICKVFATDASWQTINHAMQIHGGNGYMVDYGIERKLRDSRIGLIFEGTNEILRLFIAMNGLKGPAANYQKLDQEIQSLQSARNLEFLNNAISKIGFFSEFAFSEMKKTVLTEKLEGFHPSLEKECARLSAATRELTAACSRLIRARGSKLVDDQLQLFRLANVGIDIYLISTVLARINSVLEKCGGPEKNETELAMAKLIIRNAKVRINQNIYNLKINHDEVIRKTACTILDNEKYSFSLNP